MDKSTTIETVAVEEHSESLLGKSREKRGNDLC